MVDQTVLSFKVETTDEELTSHAGLGIFMEFVHGLGLRRQLSKHLPQPGSGRGYKSWEMVEPLVGMLVGGGRSIEDLREIRQDTGLREIAGWERIASSSAIGDWLKRAYRRKGVDGMEMINRNLLKTLLKRDSESEYTLDIDATGIKAEKREARKTYKGFKGYMPMTGHLGDNGFVVGWEFREGNESPNSNNLRFIKSCVAAMPKGRRIKYLRADSATYQSAIFNWCEAEGVHFAIGGRMTASVREMIALIPEERWQTYGSDWSEDGDNGGGPQHGKHKKVFQTDSNQTTIPG